MRRNRQNYHHGDLRESLLAEGRRMLADVGAEELSLRELARRSGVSPRAPYRHFENKEALLAALATEGFQALLDDFEESDGLPASDRLHEIAESYVTFERNDPTAFRLMFSGMIEHPDVQAVASRCFAHLLAATEQLAPGDLQGADRYKLATAIWSGLHGIAILGRVGLGGAFDSDRFVAPHEMVDALVSGWGLRFG